MKVLEFVLTSAFNKKATSFVAQVERTGHGIVITRNGRPAVLLQKIGAGSPEKWKQLKVSDLMHDTNRIIAEIEGKGARYVITRYGEPVAILRKLSIEEFTLNGERR